MTKLLITLLSMVFMIQFAYGQDLPPNPEPGKCYVRCITPDVWEEETVRIMVKPAYTTLEVVPAVFKDVEEEIMIKPASVEYIYVPATYQTVTETIRVEDSYDEIQITPASFSPGTENVEVQASYARYEYQKTLDNCDSDDPRDCMVLCYVEYPAQNTAIPIETLDSDATTDQTTVGGRSITITKEVMVSEARVEERPIDAEYTTITKSVKVSDETVREVTVEAVYSTETRRILTEAGGISVWEEIDCELTDYNVLPIFYELGSARLTPASRQIIDERLYALMVAKPLIRIELSSHTDARGSNSSNQSLSQRRAESVVNYLVSKGISRDRLEANGYGETRLVNGCKDGVDCTEAQHQENRRTEFRVLSN